MQWTIDPRNALTSGEIGAKAIRVFEATPRVIVRTSRRGFRIPSWTRKPTSPDRYCPVCRTQHTDVWYHQIVTADPDHDTQTVVMKATCDCPWSLAAKPGSDPCHHAYAAPLELQRLEFPGYKIIAPSDRPAKPRRTRRSRPLTVIPGGRA